MIISFLQLELFDMVSYNRAPWATIKRTHVGALEKGKQHEFVPITIKIPTFCDYCREIMIGKAIDYLKLF